MVSAIIEWLHGSAMPRRDRRADATFMCAGAAIACVAPPTLALAQCYYEVVGAIAPLQCPQPSLPKPNYLRAGNDCGVWVGYRSKCPRDDDYSWSIRWSVENGLETISSPPEVISAVADAVNDMGTVVGRFRAADHQEWACIWMKEKFIQIPPSPPGQWSGANCINQDGLVGGYRQVPDPDGSGNLYVAFLWQDGVLTDIEPIWPGPGAVRALNDSGQAVGLFGTITTNSRGFRWSDGSCELLDTLPGHKVSEACIVRADGTAFGISGFVPNPKNPYLFMYWPVVWPAGQTVPELLPIPDGFKGAVPETMSDRGVMVVHARNPTGASPPSRRMLFLKGEYFDLADRIIDPPWPSLKPQSISSNGEIATANGQTTWILRPVEQPEADLDGDCRVDMDDLLQLLDMWGPCSVPTLADLDHDGEVDGVDLGDLLGEWTD